MISRDRSDDRVPCWMDKSNYGMIKVFIAFLLGGYMFRMLGHNGSPVTVVLTDQRAGTALRSDSNNPLVPVENHEGSASMNDNYSSIDVMDNDNSRNTPNSDEGSDCPFSPPSKDSLEWGGWEYDLEFIKTHHIQTSPIMAQWLLWFMNKNGMDSLLDVGCGVGQLKIALTKAGATDKTLDYVGLDGGSNIMELEGTVSPVIGDEEHVIPHLCWVDASVPFSLGKKFDIVFSNEVAEHIPRVGEQHYLDNLAKHIKENGYLLLGWARIGQGGFKHVNERDATFVIGEVEKRGLVFDNELTNEFRDQFMEGSGWKYNTYFFKKGNP